MVSSACAQAGWGAYCAIIVQAEVLQALQEPPGQVACLCSLDSGVHQALPPSHSMKHKLSGVEAPVEGGRHIAFALSLMSHRRKWGRVRSCRQHGHVGNRASPAKVHSTKRPVALLSFLDAGQGCAICHAGHCNVEACSTASGAVHLSMQHCCDCVSSASSEMQCALCEVAIIRNF